MKNPKTPREEFLVTFGIYGAVGVQLAILVVGGLYLGSLVDRKFDTSPWFTLVGLLIGATAGFTNLIRIISWKGNRNNPQNRS